MTYNLTTGYLIDNLKDGEVAESEDGFIAYWSIEQYGKIFTIEDTDSEERDSFVEIADQKRMWRIKKKPSKAVSM